VGEITAAVDAAPEVDRSGLTNPGDGRAGRRTPAETAAAVGEWFRSQADRTRNQAQTRTGGQAASADDSPQLAEEPDGDARKQLEGRRSGEDGDPGARARYLADLFWGERARKDGLLSDDWWLFV
jgi:hypothetical protein